MKTLTIANQKGGVGKSAIAVQLAYYINLILGKSVLFIDFDHQENSGVSFEDGEIAEISSINASQLFTDKSVQLENSNFLILSGDYDELLALEKQGEKKHNIYAQNLAQFLDDNAEYFDYCIIDTAPNPDVRQLSPLIVSDFLLSPIDLNKQSMMGLSKLLKHPNTGVEFIQKSVNEKLVFLGLLPNKHNVKNSKQNMNLKELKSLYSHLMIKVGRKYPSIKNRSGMADAQDEGVPIWKLSKRRGRQHWSEIKPIFEQIIKKMGKI
jgi:chromosome partitioning protein